VTGGDMTETWPVRYPDDGVRVYQSGSVTVYVIPATISASNLPITTSTPPVVWTEAYRRRLLRLEQRRGFRSYVGAHGKTHAESTPAAIADAPRKLGRWLGVVRRLARRETPDRSEPVVCSRP
jgi:hypothetical protein